MPTQESSHVSPPLLKLARLERRLLRFASERYPIPWEATQGGQLIALGERPIPTRHDILKRFPGKSSAEIDRAIARLVSFQCLAKVPLYREGQYRALELAAGVTQRVPLTESGAVTFGYQVTPLGCAQPTTFWLWLMLQRTASRLLAQHGLYLALILFALIAAAFGWNKAAKYLESLMPAAQQARPAAGFEKPAK